MAKSPTRVDLAGGTLDLWPIYAFYAPCTTVNVAISIFTQAELTPRNDQRIRLFIQDLKVEKDYATLQECLSDTDERIRLVQTLLKYWRPVSGFDLKTESQSPVGAGLGGSSSLCISILKVFRDWVGPTLPRTLTSQELVTLASNLEAQILGVPTGTQDYYPALAGGLNIIDYNVTGAAWECLPLDPEWFSAHFLLIYTGRPHQSGLNNWEVLKQTIEKNPTTRQALADLKQVSAEMRELVLERRWERLAPLLEREYAARIQLSPVFTSPEIERLKVVSLRAGAEAVKICGAGGGGCVLVWCPPHNKTKVAEACRQNGFQVLENALPVARLQDGLLE